MVRGVGQSEGWGGQENEAVSGMGWLGGYGGNEAVCIFAEVTPWRWSWKRRHSPVMVGGEPSVIVWQPLGINIMRA